MTAQARDDIKLLDQVLADQEASDGQHDATARWDGYSRAFAGFLREVGLRDFRLAPQETPTGVSEVRTIVLFELPTQLYVANQYLTKVFEDDEGVVPYQVARGFTSWDDVVPGKINLLGSWQFDLLKGREIDLFWNAASLQEMAPATARRYLRKARASRHMFLMHLLLSEEGMGVPGRRRVIGSKVMRNFVEEDRTHARHCNNRDWPYYDSFWTRKDIRSVTPRG